jgi:hypothetical protein
MFKRLLFGNEESKLNFKTSTTAGIARLYSDPAIPATETSYWKSYLQLFDSSTDVFSLLSVSDVRRALIIYPENVATLVQVLIKHLESLQSDADFSPIPQDSPSSTSVGGSLAAGLSMNVDACVAHFGSERYCKGRERRGGTRSSTGSPKLLSDLG